MTPATTDAETTAMFTVSTARKDDAERIAEIHLAAMEANPLLHAQFPTQAGRAALRRFLADKYYAIDDGAASADGSAGLLIARSCSPPSGQPGQIAAFAKWERHYPEEDGEQTAGMLEAGDLRDTHECCREFLDAYAALAEDARTRAFGDRACYHLVFVCTAPAFQGRGAASLLTREVMQRAKMDMLPVYLESTPAAVRMYEKLGFEVLDRFAMTIPQPGEPGEVTEYAEVCMSWYPLKQDAS